MKQFLAAILAILLLSGCVADTTVTKEPEPVKEAEPVTQQQPVEEQPAEMQNQQAVVVEKTENSFTNMNLEYGCETVSVEGLVEDTVGYVYQYPVFSEIAGAQTINTYYEDMMEFLESYARETVYPQTLERHTIADVTGSYEIVAADDGLQLGITYTVCVQFADSQEPESFDRTDVFHPDTGSLLGSNG